MKPSPWTQHTGGRLCRGNECCSEQEYRFQTEHQGQGQGVPLTTAIAQQCCEPTDYRESRKGTELYTKQVDKI